MPTIDLSSIEDIKELKSMMSDEFVRRENARATEQECNSNINNISARISQLGAEPESPAPIASETVDNAPTTEAVS